jgi:cell division protease FtsH
VATRPHTDRSTWLKWYALRADARTNYAHKIHGATSVKRPGARAAEQIVCGTRTTGAESDTEQTTALVRRMMTCWGMSERVGLL